MRATIRGGLALTFLGSGLGYVESGVVYWDEFRAPAADGPEDKINASLAQPIYAALPQLGVKVKEPHDVHECRQRTIACISGARCSSPSRDNTFLRH